MTGDEFRQAIAALPPGPMGPHPLHSWAFWRYDLRRKALNKDNDPAHFLQWPVINGTMYAGDAPYIRKEVKALSKKLIGVLEEPQFGDPPDLIAVVSPHKMSHILTSGNLIHQAYHLQRWLDRSAKDVHELGKIVEVGGGYGAMALLVHRLGFKGDYIIYDLPEFSLLQQYYLSNVGLESIVTFLTPEALQGTSGAAQTYDLLIGLFSLSETPILDRWRIIEAFPANAYLLAYMANWGGYQNTNWIVELMTSLDMRRYEWFNSRTERLPDYWYLIGNRKENKV